MLPPLKLRPDFGPGGLPPLPNIDSSEIETRVFTHRSFAARPTHVFEDTQEDPSPDNEQFSPVSLMSPLTCAPPLTICFSPAPNKQTNNRLEHVGDQVLGLIVTDLLQSEYPHLRVGPSTVRICDSTLYGASSPTACQRF